MEILLDLWVDDVRFCAFERFNLASLHSLIIVDKRLGRALIQVEAGLNNFWLVVLALGERLSSDVVEA